MDNEQDSTTEELPDMGEAAPVGVGEVLRAAREAKRLELSHIAGETRIAVRHLEAIEAGNFETLPSRTYAIGFAKNFARAVGLDQEKIADAVREELADGQSRPSRMAGPMEPGDPARLPSAGLAWFGGFAALILAVGLIFFYNTYFAAGTGPAPLIADAEQATGESGDAAVAADGSSGPAQVQSTTPSSDGQVVFTATGEGAWVRFYEEGGERLFEGVMEDGDTYEVPLDAEDPRLNTGRPNLFRITIDGQAVSPLTDEMVPVSDAPVSAAALLARADDAAGGSGRNN